MVQILTRKFVHAFDRYDPETPLQAKRANEQIKITAAFANAVATAIVAVQVLSQAIKETPPTPFHIITGIVIAGMVHVGGRNLVALLKPEKSDDMIAMLREGSR